MAARDQILNRYLLQGWVLTVFAAIFLFAASRSILPFSVPLLYAYVVLLLWHWKLAYWVLLCVLPVSVQLALAGKTLSLTLPAEPLMWLFLLLCPVLLLWQYKAIPKRWWQHPLVVIAGLQLVWLIVAVCCSELPFLSMKFLLAKLWMLACFFVLPVWVFRQKQDFATGFLVLLIPVVLSALVILLRHAAKGFDFLYSHQAVAGLYINHVEYAGVLSICLPGVIAGFFIARKTKYRVLLFCCAFLLLLAIYFSYARAAMLAVFFALFMVFMLRVRLAQWVMPVFYLLAVVFTVYMIKTEHYAVLRPKYDRTIYHNTFDSHIAATFRGSDVSSMERLYRWTAALRMSREKPLTGFGPHAFHTHYKPYALPSFRTYSSDNKEHSTTHNYFLYMLTEQGYPAMLLYALLMAVFFARAQHLYYWLSDPVYKKYCVALLMMMAACFVNNLFSELIETPKIGALFYLSIAALVLLDLQTGNSKAAAAVKEK